MNKQIKPITEFSFFSEEEPIKSEYTNISENFGLNSSKINTSEETSLTYHLTNFNPANKYKQGAYISGIDIPSGFVQITVLDTQLSLSVPLSITVLKIATLEKFTYQVTVNSFWMNFDFKSVVVFECVADFSLNIFQESSVIYDFDKTYKPQIFKIGRDLLLPCKITDVIFQDDNSAFYVSTSEDGILFKDPIISSKGVLWLDSINSNFIYIFSKDSKFSYKLKHSDSLQYQTQPAKFFRGWYKSGLDIPSGWVKIQFPSKNFKSFDYLVKDASLKTVLINKSIVASCWIKIPSNQFLVVDTLSRNAEFKVYSENSVNFDMLCTNYYSCMLKSGIDIPLGWNQIYVDSSIGSDELLIAESDNPQIFCKEYSYKMRSIWYFVKENTFIRIRSQNSSLSFGIQSIQNKLYNSNQKFCSGIRRVGVDIPEGFVKVCLSKNNSDGFQYSISSDPLSFQNFTKVKVKGTWIYLSKSQFVLLLPNDPDQSFIFRTIEEARSYYSDSSEFYQSVYMIGCEVPCGVVSISTSSSYPFYYSLSDSLDCFDNSIMVSSSTCKLDLSNVRFLKIVSSDSSATFKFSLV